MTLNRRTLRLVVSSALALTGLVGVAPSADASVATITVGGRILRSDGRPAADATVSLSYHPDAFGVLVAAASFGSACLLTDLCDSDHVSTTTDGKGRWHMRLVRTGHLATYAHLDLTVRTSQGSGLATTASFHQRNTTLADLRLWAGHLMTTRAPGHVLAAAWTPLPDDRGAEPHYDVTSENAKGRTTSTRKRVDSGDPVDDRLYQSGDKVLVVTATAQQERYGEVTYRSQPVPLTHLATPISRHDPVREITSKGGLTKPVPRWSDGDRGTEVGDSGGDFDTAVIVDLKGQRTVSAVTLDPCTFECTVKTSTDGRHWVTFAELGALDHEGDVVVTGVPVRARYVRWTSEFTIDYTGGTEISVW